MQGPKITAIIFVMMGLSCFFVSNLQKNEYIGFHVALLGGVFFCIACLTLLIANGSEEAIVLFVFLAIISAFMLFIAIAGLTS